MRFLLFPILDSFDDNTNKNKIIQEIGKQIYYKKLNEIMFIFFGGRQVKEQKQAPSVQVKRFQEIALISNPKNIVSSSNLLACYAEIQYNLKNGWDYFNKKYEEEMVKIRKRESSWNYSDIRIVRSCIKRSIQSETLSVLVGKWCRLSQKLLFESLEKKSHNDSLTENKTKEYKYETKLQYIHKQISILCEFTFKCAFVIYEKFFIKHYYLKSQSNNSQLNLSKEEIYEKERKVFQTFVLNCISGIEDFTQLYRNKMLSILKSNEEKQLSEGQKIKQYFQEFIKKQFNLQENLNDVYENTKEVIWNFQIESKLDAKIEKACKIISTIESDHKSSLQRTKSAKIERDEPILVPLLVYLFKCFCPQIKSSIKYIKLMVCHRFSIKEIEKEFKDTLYCYCYLWLNENAANQFQVIFEAANNI